MTARGDHALPPEWTWTRLQRTSAFITKGTTPTTFRFGWKDAGVLFLRSECVSPNGLDLGQSMFVSLAAHRFMRRSEVQDGDILMTITGNVGRVVLLANIGTANINQHIARIRVLDPEVDEVFVYHFLSQDSVRGALETITTGQAYPQISLAQVRAIEIPMPSPEEQRAIATALTDVDDLVAALERVIAKKRAIRQGVMQQLLTGRKRLAGFTGSWVPLHLASCSALKARIGWQGLTTQEYRDAGSYRLVGGTDFVDGRVNWNTTPYVDKWRYDQDQGIQLRKGDVLLTKDGTIGKTAYINQLPGPATLNSGVFVIRPLAAAYDSQFLYYKLRSRTFEKFLARLSAGSTISHLYQRDLVGLSLEVPPTIAEQREIAGLLSDMDAEIEALESRHAKTQDIKQGAMQELLTGRTRLVSNTEQQEVPAEAPTGIAA